MSAPVAVLISGGGTNLQALIDACATPDFPAHIAVVLSNRKSAQGLQRAEAAGIPTEWLPHRRFDGREAYDAALVDQLRKYEVQWVCLAGFMRIVTPVFLDAFPNRVLNIHPSLLPAFPGLDGQGQAHAYGVRIAGATVHLVNAGTDTGPILVQGALGVHPDEDADALRSRILGLEHQLYPKALRWAVEGRFSLRGRRVDVDLPAGEHPFVFA